MAYGEHLTKLNPLTDATILNAMRESLPTTVTLLDLGCGRGDRLHFLAEEIPALQLYGIDADAENAALAAKCCPEAEICFGDASALPYADGMFDLVLCECSFSLFSAPEVCAAEIARVLRPGGVLLLGDLYARCDPYCAELLAGDGTVKSVRGRSALEALFTAAQLAVEGFDDFSGDLLQMLGQMLMDGALCECLGMDALLRMKTLKTGYGLWRIRKPCCAVVTAAGLSSRMGDFKPLLPFGTVTVAEAALANLRDAGVGEIVVVTGYRASELRNALRDAGVVFADNPDFRTTQMYDSLRIGLAALPSNAQRVLIQPVDLPAILSETIAALLRAPGAVARPVCGGRSGHPLSLDAALIPALLAYGGADGLRGALAALQIPVTPLMTEDVGTLMDADTKEDYVNLLKLLELRK